MERQIEDYILSHIDEEPENLKRLGRDVNLRLLYPRMCSGHLQGRLLKMLTAMVSPRRVLEIGTYAGYSALCIAEGLPAGATLDTVEIDDEMEDFIRGRFAQSPYGSRITLHIGDIGEVASGLTPGYDMVFLDANKRTYLQTFNLIRPLVRPGGFVVADNTLWDGKVADPVVNHDPQTLGICEFNDFVAADPMLEKVMLPLRDGLTLIRVDAPKVRRIAVVGMFDGVHAGHRFLLDALRRAGGERGLQPMVVTFSNHPLDVVAPGKSPRLLTGAVEKANLLKAEGVEAVVLPFDGSLRRTSAAGFLRMLHDSYGVDCLMLGFNNRFGCDAPASFDDYVGLGRECGVEILKADEYRAGGEPVSSSAVRSAVVAGDMEKAAKMLGRCYSIDGVVVGGRRIGRTIGFPTANVAVDDRRLLPAEGVYAAVAVLPDGSRRGAVVNVGRRPTVEHGESEAPVKVEVHLLGFGGNLYENRIRVELHGRIRSEKRFGSLDELKMQIEADCREAIALLGQG